MNILQQFLDAIQYRINDAWEHQWTSYEGAQVLGCDNEFATMSVAFKREDQTVISITVASGLEAQETIAYRWINPDYNDAIVAEADRRRLNHNEAFEGCDYIELEVVDDILEKGVAMLSNSKFDPRIQIPLDLDDDTLLVLFKKAHKRDISFNQLMNEILIEAVDELDSDN